MGCGCAPRGAGAAAAAAVVALLALAALAPDEWADDAVAGAAAPEGSARVPLEVQETPAAAALCGEADAAPETAPAPAPASSRRELRYLGGAGGSARLALAAELYASVEALPLVCPHGHVDPAVLADEMFRWRTPTELFVKPDHYLLRLMRSQARVSAQALGVEPRGPRAREGTKLAVADDRSAWRTFCTHAHVLRGTPTALWLRDSLESVFGWADWPLGAHNADASYDFLVDALAAPAAAPRSLLASFNVELLSTTDAATSDLAAHAAIARAPGVSARVVPTLRPDALFKVGAPGFLGLLQQLNAVSGVEVSDYDSFLVALRQRRRAFVDAGALATDHGVNDLGATPIAPLSTLAARMTFAQALEGRVAPEGAAAFEGHMLFEMARMSAQDGLVMQLHCGVYRDHDAALRDTFGPDSGGDVPRAQEFVRALRPLLAEFGSHPNMTIIIFTLDEDAYARELAPLAGAYPALKLGPPWWFHDSRNGMRRYLDRVTESAGVYSLAGFNDDTRAFPSIPARHALWRRAVSGWAAGMVDDGAMDMEEAKEVVYELAYGLAKKAYRVQEATAM